jgi:formylglycine-generating enzyme required for sulfatase activity
MMGKKLSLVFLFLLIVWATPAPAEEAKTDVAAHAEHKAGETFRDCANCPEMVVIPPGEFLMGTSQADMNRYLEQFPAGPKKITFPGGSLMWDERKDAAGRMKNELPQHLVHIPQPFALGKYPVTRGEFADFVKETNYKPQGDCIVLRKNQSGHYEKVPGLSWQNPGIDQTDRDPVVCVNVHDAEAYVAWLNAKVKNPASAKGSGPYRLPNEAEFEYAARAGTQTAYWWGDEIGTNNAVCNGCGSPWDNRATAPVGSFKPNPFGLYDMHGNVWEWMADCRNDNYSGAPTNGSAWMTGNCEYRSVRGGSWFDGSIALYAGSIELRSAYRGCFGLDVGTYDSGFRLARTLQ